MELGKLPPQAVDIEEIVLGSILSEPNAITNIADILNPECFYKSGHQIIFAAALKLFKENNPIDILTVTNELRTSGKIDEVGGPFYITKLTSNIGSTAHLEFHAKILFEKYISRELIQIGSKLQNDAFDDSIDILEKIEKVQIKLFELLKNKGKDARHISDIQKERMCQLIDFSKSESKSTGVTSGYNKIDRITSGWQKGDLNIIAARPSMGKTTIAFDFGINAAKDSIAVLIFSLEMKDTQLYDKALSGETKIENSYLRTGKLNDDEWLNIANKSYLIDKLPIYIDDTPALNIVEFKAKSRRLKLKYDIQLIIVDYLQLMKCPEAYKRGGREREVSEISSQLKATAKELDIPIIALSQLNRSAENRGDKKPQLSDLRESGSIEQDADMVIFIHRPEYYGMLEDKAGGSLKNQIDIIIAKHRNGVTGDLKFWKNNNWTTISEGDSALNETIPF